MAFRGLPVERYSTRLCFPTLAPASDRSDQLFRSTCVDSHDRDPRCPGMVGMCKQDAEDLGDCYRVNSGKVNLIYSIRRSQVDWPSSPQNLPLAPMVWTPVDDTPSPNRVFTRPVDNNEVGFFYDSTFNGVADMAEHYVVQTTRDSLFELANVARTWIALKRIFPLLGATTMEMDYETTSASFTVAEADLSITRPGEVDLLTVNSEAEVHEFVERLISGPRQLSLDLLSRVYIFPREDNPGLYHVVIHIAHLITDGVSVLTLVRTFFDILSLPPMTHIPDLEKRLALCVGPESLNPNRNLPLPRRRWMRAIGWVIHHIRDPKIQVS